VAELTKLTAAVFVALEMMEYVPAAANAGGFTLSVGGNARADASDAGEATSNPESLGNLDAQGGTASIAAETGGLVAITGNATVQANGIAGYNTAFGIGGSGALARLASGMVRRFDHGLQLLACVEGDDAARSDRDFLTGLGVAPGPLRLFAELEIAEARQLHAAAFLERGADLLEEALDHVLRFPLVEAELFEEEVGQFGFGERHREACDRNVAPKRVVSIASSCPTMRSPSASVKVRSVSRISTRIATLFIPLGSSLPR